ncbi:putative nuclear pore complex protein NUP35 [Iris pallida]|uniref:Nuclear pore complex protein NUP35 n=1 Tax=Iris pallida TaxID=29817 RepID=A0AAX6HMF7_IRIPA|nr:putative nuclear pore complex protein NUP35 [Iris pallida]KAJ6842236.1 putative nuclear pore complex protein NUP35 [Iris pallida]
MSASAHRTSTPDRRHQQSVFFRDLASPISSSHRLAGRFATPDHASVVSALWRDNLSSAAAADPPPPPAFTLDDRLDFSPEPDLLLPHPSTPEPASASAPTPKRNHPSPPSPARAAERSPGSGSCWSPMRVGSEDMAVAGRSGSPVEGVVQQKQPGELLMLPPPREVARPETRSNLPMVPAAGGGGMDEEEWVTVYGFFPGDTNLVLREFEKCGVILKHIPGPRDANWMHILYQNRYDAQKALGKNGMQLNSALIVGVKPVDPVQRQYLNEKLNGSAHGGFMVSSHPQLAVRSAVAPVPSSSRPNYLTNGSSDTHGRRQDSTGAIASPEKSVVSKLMDLMFGL